MRKTKSFLLRNAVRLMAGLTVAAVVVIIGYIIIKGLPNLTLDFLFGSDGGIWPTIVVTLYMIGLALLIAAPAGIFCAIYLVEYAKRGNRAVKLIRVATESLAGIPSIIYGLFGMLFFVVALGWSWSLLSGALTVSIMVLPIIIRSTEEALKSVPDSYREGSYGLGAGKLRTIFRIILPSALPGVLAAVILSMGRIIGETAAVMLTAGTVARLPKNLFQSGRTLSVHMYILAKEGIDFGKAYATALTLIVTILLLNFAANRLSRRLRKD